MIKNWKKFIGAYKYTVLLCFLFLFSAVYGVSANSLDTRSLTDINMVMGELVTLATHSLTRVSVADPEIADITDADDRHVVLVAKGVGQTALFLWDEYGRKTVMVKVNSQNLVMVQERVETLLDAIGVYGVNLEINEQEGKVICTGDVLQDKMPAFNQVVAPFMEDMVLLINRKKLEDMIMIDAQVTELDTTLTKYLGVEWHGADPDPDDPETLIVNEDLILNFTEQAIGSAGDSFSDIFKTGDIPRTSHLLASVNAIVEEGEGRILSKPKLMVKSGEEASFLVGGEVPIRSITTVASGDQVEDVKFKEYGISMHITPTTTEDRRINLGLKIEITEIDESVRVGDDVGYTKRNTETQLLLEDGQNVVIAGLIKNKTLETTRKVPFLGDIPIVGAIFRNKSIPENLDQELVVSLTPNIVSEDTRAKKKKEPELEMEYPEIAMETPQVEIVEVPSYIPILEDEDTAMPVSAPAAGTPQYAGVPLEFSNYIFNVQKKIFDSIEYPQQAEEYGWEGIVKIEMLILNDGTLAFALVDESSGYEVFDENAVETARAAAPFDPFPSGAPLSELNISIPIVYNMQQ